jgi:hypothetical protein
MTNEMKFTNMSDFLKASPFDPEYDLDQTLTPDMFYNHLHVTSDKLAELSNELDRLICSDYEPNRVIFVRGYAGNGKTTFLKTFIRERTRHHHEYFDFQEQRRTVHSETPEYDPETDEILLLLKRRLKSMTGITDALQFMADNRQVLKDADFISSGAHAALTTTPPNVADQDAHVRTCLDQFGFKDTFACFFVNLFRDSKPEGRTIVYFDNLDMAPMEHIADHFLLHFQDALLAALYISRHELFGSTGLDFRTRFRFVFCFRDANEAILNAHLGERIGFARTPFTVLFDSGFYKQVAKKRLTYLAKAFPNRNVVPRGTVKFSAVLEAIVDDDSFGEIFLGLYNYDYREVISVLVNVIGEAGITARRVNYETRAELIFGIVRMLLRRDFMLDYLAIPDDTRDGYCYIDRVMLTVLINASGYRRVLGGRDTADAYPLFYLIKDLAIVYPDVSVVLDSVARCFLSHKRNRIHLVTILNRKVEDAPHFVDTYEQLFNEVLGGDDGENVQSIKRELKRIQVRVNPAGFTYVRYLLPHFEFYSNLARNDAPLFRDPLKRVIVNDVAMYSFEQRIDAVFRLVRRHATSMKTFFNKRYIPAGFNAMKFATSKYCFRHAGSSALAQARGQSHTIKVITAHINHIDLFRRRLLAKPWWTHSRDRDRAHINQLLVERIRRYVDLLSEALDIEVARSFAAQFEKPIQAIAKSGYANGEIEIRLDHDEEAYRSPPPRQAAR